MSKRAFEKIKAGLDSAKAYQDGTADKAKYRIHIPQKIDVRKIRTRLGLSQEAFAQTYGFALSAVRDWEQGRRRPARPARIFRHMAETAPHAGPRAWAGGRPEARPPPRSTRRGTSGRARRRTLPRDHLGDLLVARINDDQFVLQHGEVIRLERRKRRWRRAPKLGYVAPFTGESPVEQQGGRHGERSDAKQQRKEKAETGQEQEKCRRRPFPVRRHAQPVQAGHLPLWEEILDD